MTHSGHPSWPLFVFFTALVVLEIVSMSKNRRPYTVILFGHLVRVLLHTAEELRTDSEGRRLCGMALAILIIASAGVVLWAVHGVFVHPNNMGHCVCCFLFCPFSVSLIFFFAWVNEHYISFRNRLSPDVDPEDLPTLTARGLRRGRSKILRVRTAREPED